MKKSVLLLFFILLGYTLSYSQTFIGFRGSGNITSLSTADAKSRFGFKAGGMLSTPLSEKLFFQPSLLVSLDGSKSAKKYNPDYSASTYSLEVPLMLSLRAGDEDVSVGFDFGAFARYAFAGSYWTDSDEGRIKPDIFDSYKRFNFGPQVGFSVMVNGFYIGSSFQFGVIKPWDGKRGCSYNYGINIGYLFELY
ncbi:outer membrane beta-barrel protein [Dysgonomonas macrotermitis]|uniref:Outer membrane protein beta-barrel domain-containing protein n=1 Tax=Dysgonomonas macrotermitis TaxID=1346286 RepID=A0A1M5IPP8_9BACT|nr:outer membrane beta-barrel protein [Dysgonomonas macrotermitis]SHG29753.1 Outer membrane protein beta-barrel domain-containing protein [Dysgonomonas macrotermitis]